MKSEKYPDGFSAYLFFFGVRGQRDRQTSARYCSNPACQNTCPRDPPKIDPLKIDPLRERERERERQRERESRHRLNIIRYCGIVCTGCDRLKCQEEYAKRDKTHHANRCRQCQYPSCTKCGYHHTGNKPVAPFSVKEGIWFCTKCKPK